MIHSGWGRDNSIVTIKHEIASSIVMCHNPIIYKEIVNPIVTGLFLPQYSGYLLNKTCFQIKKKSWTLNKMFSQMCHLCSTSIEKVHFEIKLYFDLILGPVYMEVGDLR